MVVPIEAPPPELDAGALGNIADDLAGALSFLLKPIGGVLARFLRWIYHEEMRAVGVVFGDLASLSETTERRLEQLSADIASVAVRGGATIIQQTVNVVGDFSAQLDGLRSYVDGAENYVIGIAEDLYNRAVAQIAPAEGYVIGIAEDLYNRAVAQIGAAEGYTIGVAEDLYNRSEADARVLYDQAVGVAQTLYGQATQYADTITAPLAGEIVGIRPWIEGLVALSGAEVLAHAITTVRSLYDECCGFTTDELKPLWNGVKGMLGKLTSRGPLALVVMGAAAETVVALDRKEIVAMLKQARTNELPAHRDTIREWGRFN